MIDEIEVQNLALIRNAHLRPSRGLSVITGETGAGKTALLSALKLLMGARASADMVRDGEESLRVAGRFFGLRRDGGSERPAEDGPVGEGDDEVVVVRTVGADGRSRASVNAAMASIGELGSLVGPSVDLCGQFEHQRLMKVANHVKMLDAWAGDEAAQALEAYRKAYGEVEAARAELARLEQASATASAQLADARLVVKRIDEVNPYEGEYEQLVHDLEIAENAESLSAALGGAHEALSGDGGALDALNAAASALESVGSVDADLAALARSLREAGYVLEDVSAQSRDYREGIEFDEQVLAGQQERLAQMKGLLHAFGPRMADVFAARAAAAEVVSLADDSVELREAAERALARAEAALAEAADVLDAVRNAAAPRFAREVTSVMSRLKMGGAELVCAFERLAPSSWTKTGPSSFEFLYRPGEGMQARPLARIASGGEVSRVMLATKVVLGAVDDVDTLVFDEVDAGIGGAVAVALAEVISDLARTHQVIVVTHLAQVAVKGDAHYVVRRVDGKQGPETVLAPVVATEREEEIARMLSGAVTEASLSNAREMLGA